MSKFSKGEQLESAALLLGLILMVVIPILWAVVIFIG